MSIVVEHEKRRKEILEKALDVFIKEGYVDATFQKIADKCSITRTTLYLYFKNKKDIFNYSIKLLLTKLEDDIRLIRSDDSLDSVEKITEVIIKIFRHIEENRLLLSVILDYLLHLSKRSGDPEKPVRRRTLRLRHILSTLIIEGIKTGKLKPVNVKKADEYLYGFIEAAIFRLTVLRQETVGDLRETAVFAVKQLQITDNNPCPTP
jgi:AcrR family transcriptional regulator